MFAPISLILALLFSTSTLPNGIRLTEIPPDGDTVSIVAGYQTTGALPDHPSVRALTLAAYSAGANPEFFSEVDRTGFRVRIPSWAKPMMTSYIIEFFRDAPSPPTPEAGGTGFREKVELEIRDALLGLPSQASEYGTDRAFLSMTGPIPGDLRNALGSIPARASNPGAEAGAARLPAERTLRFVSDQPSGGVIFASPVPSVHYRAWYSVLLLDRLLHRVLKARTISTLKPSLYPYYYRLELPVPPGQFPEPVEETLLQEIQRLQFSRPKPEDLDAARRQAMDFLESREIKEWFATQGVPERLAEGIQWIQTSTPDDIRIAARDLLITNRVIATWPPKAQRTSARVEPLSIGNPAPLPGGGRAASGGTGEENVTPSAIPLPTLTAHSHVSPVLAAPVRLSSGVSVVPSTINGVFLSGGALTLLDHETGLPGFQPYRPDRILALAPASDIERVSQVWATFTGTPADRTVVVPRGSVSTGDIAALFLLKLLIDRKLIEGSIWREAQLRIDASQGAALEIIANEIHRSRIIGWIKAYGASAPSESEMAWVREAAAHHLPTVLPHLQAITWERDPLGIVQDVQTVGASHVQDIARTYFN